MGRVHTYGLLPEQGPFTSMRRPRFVKWFVAFLHGDHAHVMGRGAQVAVFLWGCGAVGVPAGARSQRFYPHSG